MQASPFKIERGIPTPKRYPGFKEMLGKMKIGESVLLPSDLPEAPNYPYVAARRLGIKIAMRREGKGYRLWRME